VIVVAENETQDCRLARPVEEGGYGLDALWNDDFHHSAVVALTGRREAYYTDYHGGAQEFISSVKYGYLFQGQRYKWQKNRRGTPAWGLRPAQFVNFVENHDQAANSGRGERLHKRTSMGRYKAAAALLLLAPGTPMLFQGQEFASSAPFSYFADHVAGLREKVEQGRIQFLSQFRSLDTPEMRACHRDPGLAATFEQCKLDFRERDANAGIYQLHKDLLRLRREDPAFGAQRPGGVDGAVLSAEAFVLRYFHEGGDRLLIVNFGGDLHLDPAPEPLLAPPEGCIWRVTLSTEHPRYGGSGSYAPDTSDNWRIPGQAAVALVPEAANG
jgi:maltooligosyltrehalose trehalohydrolase